MGVPGVLIGRSEAVGTAAHVDQSLRLITRLKSTSQGVNRRMNIFDHTGSKTPPTTLSPTSFATGETCGLSRMTGFDTFWYTWSLVHPETEVLRYPVLSHPEVKAQGVQSDSK